MDDSSSESAMEDGSMDGSEHEYDGYDLDPDDDEPQDEYDEIPDEEDDEDMDDEDSGPYEMPSELQDAMNGLVNQLRVLHRHDVHAMRDVQTIRAVDLSGEGRVGLVSIEASSAGQLATEEIFRSLVEDSGAPMDRNREFIIPRQISRRSGLHFPSLSQVQSVVPLNRLRPRSYAPDISSGPDAAERIHPALSRPETPRSPGSSRIDNFRNLEYIISSMQGSGSRHGFAGLTVNIETFPASPDASRSVQHTQAAFDDALANFDALSHLVSAGNGEVAEQELPNGPSVPEEEAASGVSPVVTEPLQARPVDEVDAVLPVAPVPHPGASPSLVPSSISPRIPAGALSSADPGILPLGRQSANCGRLHIASDDLESAMSFMRRPHMGRISRERDRSCERRWTYDPPGNGGDDLPASFGGATRSQRSRSSHDQERRTSASSVAVAAAQSFQAVNKLEEKVFDRLAAFAVELRKIDHTVNKGISDAKKRIEKANKKKSEESTKTEAATEGADKAPGLLPPETQSTRETLAALAERALNEIAGNPASDPAPGDRLRLPVGERTPEEPIETAEAPGANVDADPDNVMRTPGETDLLEPDEDVPSASTAAAAEEASPSAGPAADADTMAVASEEPTDGATGAQAEGSTDAGPEPGSGAFPTVAAARAALIGISLDAPQSNDPSVVRAALDSTGIDPTFLSALPDEMRADVLNDHFHRVRANVPPAAEAGAGPVTTLNQDFLIALPPELRAEVLEAEVEYDARNPGGGNAAPGEGGAGGNNPGGAGATGGAAAVGVPDMDNASFLATLTPELREEILITAPDTLLASLPPDVAAEARSLRERETASRIQTHPWSGGAGGEAPVMFRRDMHSDAYDLPRMRRDHERREVRREEMGMRWEKVDGVWTRVRPKEDDEPNSPLDEDALTAVVQLMRLKQSTFGKAAVFQVLSSACKSSKAREKVLTLLLAMVTSGNGSRAETGTTTAVYATESTIVRRALELLVQLCKNDQTVAESLIGLPTMASPSKLKDSKGEDVETRGKVESSDVLCLSTLTSLISSPLFTRSNTHLQQLLVVISYVCQAFPPSQARKSERPFTLPSRLEAFLSRQRIVDVMGDGEDDDDDHDSRQHHLMVQMDPTDMYHGGHGERELSMVESLEAQFEQSHARDFRLRHDISHSGPGGSRSEEAQESSDSSDDDDEREGDELVAGEGNNAPRESDTPGEETGAVDIVPRAAAASTDDSAGAAGESGEANTVPKSKSKKKKEKKQDIIIPVERRVPMLSKHDLNALVLVLKRPGFTHWTYDLVSIALGQLGELPCNRAVTISALSQSAQDLGLQVKKAYALFKNELDGAEETKRKQAMSQFATGSYACELTLLRLIKTASTLLNQASKKGKSSSSKSGDSSKNKPETVSQDPEVMAELRESKELVFSGLQELWTSLNDILDLVNSDLEGSSKDRKKRGAIPGTEYPSSGRTEGLARMARNRKSRKNLSPVLARLSPTIESFFIAHSALIDTDGDRATKDTVSSPLAVSPRDSILSPGGGEYAESNESMAVTRKLGKFIERHRVPVNALLRSDPGLLETSFNMALKHSHAIDFDNKKAYFRSLIKKKSSHGHSGSKTVRLKVRRNHVYQDSFFQLRGRTKEEMKGRLHVQFSGEEGIDAGGVTREWYIILARQIFDANYALFCRSAAKAATYQPDKRSYINSEHLENFKFVGRVIAKAIYDGQLIDAYFTRSFYKHILGIKPTYHDIEAQDPDYYNSLKWILENDITGVLDHTMSAEYEEFGRHTVVDLMPNGRNIPVTEENKADYVRLVTEVRLTKAISTQIEAFKKGFHELIPLEDCKIFNEVELELLMSGLPDIDMADLKANVEYTGYSSSSPQVNWFWRCVEHMDQEDLARLVMFVTGTSKVPLEGFSGLQGMNGAQKFQIHRISGDSKRLPTAHTCFNQLDLPEYASAEVLSERLLRAVRECNVGFGFA